VLRELSRRMVRNLREFDMAARLGGEEFVIVMPECEPEIAMRVRRLFMIFRFDTALLVLIVVNMAAKPSF